MLKKKKFYKLIDLRKSIALLALIVIQTSLFGQTVNYTELSNSIANPERGLQKYSITANNYAITVGANNLPVSTLSNWKNSLDNVTIVYRYFLLDAFINSNINDTFLNNIQQDFNNVRTAGFKIIVRFSYSNAQGSGAQQPIKSQILTHISQLSSLLNTNKDIIFSHQAGFIGTWGEWYYTNSTEFGTDGNITAAQWANRKDIVDAMLAATPIEIPIQVRYAEIKKAMYGNTQLTEQTAYQNTANARIGFFNDAFLNDYGDQGTYSVSNQCQNPLATTDYTYISNETKYLPMTGETNGLNSCNNGFRTTGANAINELNLTNWTTINRDYYIPFWNQVISTNDYDSILKKLGYRFILNSSTLTSNGTNFDLDLNISNVGFARVFKQKTVYLVIKNIITNAISTQVINTDIRTWENDISISQNFDFQLSGTFQLYLWIPDNEYALATNPDYSIQFANTGTWEPLTGYNNLMQTITLNTLGVEAVLLNNVLSLSPNPASEFITVKLNGFEKGKIQIYNTTGKLVKEVSILNNQKIDISKLSNGLYFIGFNNQYSTHKFIKQ